MSMYSVLSHPLKVPTHPLAVAAHVTDRGSYPELRTDDEDPGILKMDDGDKASVLNDVRAFADVTYLVIL